MSDLLVLCYHGVSELWPAPMSVTPEAIQSQLELLVRRGYRGATFSEAATEPTGKTAVVTFDDGLHSVLEKARPILADLGFPGTVFVPTDFPSDPGRPMSWPGIDRWLGGEHEHELLPMSWEELGGLVGQGWEIGSHTRSHAHLTRLSDAVLDEELIGSRETLEQRLGRPCRALAYPYSDFDDRVAAAAMQAGYLAAATLSARFSRSNALHWPRVGVYQQDEMRRYRLKVSRAIRAARTTSLWPAPRRRES